MNLGVRAFTGKQSRLVTLRLFVGCCILCCGSSLLAAGFWVTLTGGLYPPISVYSFAAPFALGGAAVLWLRLFGFPTLIPLRTILEQRVICFSLLWVFLQFFTLSLVALNFFSNDHNEAFGTLGISAGLHCFENTILIVIAALGCSLFPLWDRLFTHTFRIATDISHEELTRLSWYLSQRKLKQQVHLVPITTDDEWLQQSAFASFDALVTSQQVLGIPGRGVPALSAFLGGLPVLDVEYFAVLISRRIELSRLEISALLAFAPPPSSARLACESIKRAVEPALGTLLAAVLSPLMALIAIAVKLSSPGPVIYRQVRAGVGGRNFTLLKFRTMRVDAEASGPQWSSAVDSRVTPLGKFLRATRLDEIPQLWNVMAGDLSFIGPRPERPEMVKKLVEHIPAFPLRNAMRPGITGWAQVRAGYAASVDESLSKLEHDLYYGLFSSFVFDIEILFRTLVVAIFGDRQVAASEERKTMQALVADSANEWAHRQSLASGQ